MSGYAAVDDSGSVLLGMDLPTHSETPGLGGRISEPWFKEQFRNLPLTEAGTDPFVFKPAPGGNIDAITGATQTSEAVRKLLTEDIARFVGRLQEETP
jgi:Na+-transporting NADH:ubiquinone oxidoreductase subunit C